MANQSAPRPVTVGTTPTQILPAVARSRNAAFRHTSSGVILNIGIDAATASNNIYPLTEKDEFAFGGTNAVYGNVSSGSVTVYVWESFN